MATIQLTSQDFKDKVFNYDEQQEWKYKGTVPAIIDFYADWCAPCKIVEPVLEELSTEYEGELVIYKVNIDNEEELSSTFGIQSIPTFLFVPITGNPIMQRGALPKKTFQQVIQERLQTQAVK